MADMTIVTFFTTHATLRAEKAVKAAGIPADLVPTPRQCGLDCALALSVPSSHEVEARAVLEAQGIEISGICHPGPDA